MRDRKLKAQEVQYRSCQPGPAPRSPAPPPAPDTGPRPQAFPRLTLSSPLPTLLSKPVLTIHLSSLQMCRWKIRGDGQPNLNHMKGRPALSAGT